MNRYGTDLPDEQGLAVTAPPTLRRGFSSHHEKQTGTKLQFYPAPPLTARTFSFFTQDIAQNSRVLGTDWKRRGLLIQNLSSQSVYMSVGSEAGFDGTTFTDALEIPVGTVYEFPANACPVNDVYVVSASAGAHIVVIESTMAGLK